MVLENDTPDPCTLEAQRLGCTCRVPVAGPTDINPPEPRIDQWCPLHGRDPDWERDKQQDHMA